MFVNLLPGRGQEFQGQWVKSEENWVLEGASGNAKPQTVSNPKVEETATSKEMLLQGHSYCGILPTLAPARTLSPSLSLLDPSWPFFTNILTSVAMKNSLPESLSSIGTSYEQLYLSLR